MAATDSRQVRQTTDQVPFRFTLRRLLVWTFFISVALAGFKVCHDAVQIATRGAIANGSQSSFNLLQNALQNYHLAHGEFPPAYIADKHGKPMHSWRVLVLPYIEEQALFDQYNFNEPWNGPNNSKLANRMPQTFHVVRGPDSTTYTNVVAVVGPGTAFPASKSTRLSDFKDGPENTILLAEIADSKIPWLQPCDLDAETLSVPVSNDYKPTISSVSWRLPYVVFADSIGTYGLSDKLPPDLLRALTTIDGEESVTRASLMTQGYLKK